MFQLRRTRQLFSLSSRGKSDFAVAQTSVDHTVQHVGVIGAGQMGIGITLVTAMNAQLPVTILDSNQNQLQKQMKFLDLLLQKDIQKGKITEEERQAIRSRISVTSDIKQFEKCDFVIEAVSENPVLKRELFHSLSKITKPDAILASNTSSISITKIASSTDRPKKVIGMHFMNPVPVMKLVEIIPGLASDVQTVQQTRKLAHAMGKTTTLSDDVPGISWAQSGPIRMTRKWEIGFIANRLLMPYINEAVFALQERLGTKEDIDTTMKLGTNMPMGPLTLADFIGLDTCLAIMRVLHGQLGDTKYRPAPLLIKYVDAGWLGKKSGRGFHEYPSSK